MCRASTRRQTDRRAEPWSVSVASEPYHPRPASAVRRKDPLCASNLCAGLSPIHGRELASAVRALDEGLEGLGFGRGDGTVTGEISGTVAWANYPRRREDGVWMPNLRGVITTADGSDLLIAVHGQSVQEKDSGRRAILARVELTTEAATVSVAEHLLRRRRGRDRRGARPVVARCLRLLTSSPRGRRRSARSARPISSDRLAYRTPGDWMITTPPSRLTNGRDGSSDRRDRGAPVRTSPSANRSGSTRRCERSGGSPDVLDLALGHHVPGRQVRGEPERACGEEEFSTAG